MRQGVTFALEKQKHYQKQKVPRVGAQTANKLVL